MAQVVGIEFQYGGPAGSTPQPKIQATMVLEGSGDIALMEKFCNLILKPLLEKGSIAAQNSMPGGHSIGYSPLTVLNIDHPA